MQKNKYFQTYYDTQQKYTFESPDAAHSRISREFLNQIKSKAEDVAQQIQSQWPCTSTQIRNFTNCPEFNFSEVLPKINVCLARWKQNMELKEFFKQLADIVGRLNTATSSPPLHNSLYPSRVVFPLPQRGNHHIPNLMEMFDEELVAGMQDKETRMMSVTEKMQTCTLTDEIQQPGPSIRPGLEPFPLLPIVSKLSCPVAQFYLKGLQLSWDSHQRSMDMTKPPKSQNHTKQREFYRQQLEGVWIQIERELQLFHPKNSFLSYNLALKSGLYPRISVPNLLALVAGNVGMKRRTKFYGLLISYGVLLTQLQRQNRILRYESAGMSMEGSLTREMENQCHSNWDPATRPEWLLFEIEMDLTIRAEQISVALQMEQPPDGRSSLMQLNMGEGKTTVILPLLILSLADKIHLCRVTILRSLFQVNKDFLRASLGGVLLNKRLYFFPCRRDFNITTNEICTMEMSYKECLEKGGFVLTVPEHRLSFQLKGIEKCRDGKVGVPLLELQEWIHANARDVLDECDELLREKYQLVYTVGPQLPLDGGAARWGVIQKLLKLVPVSLEQLIEKYGPEVGECVRETGKPETFPRSRIFKLDRYKELCEMLVREILVGDQKRGRTLLELPTNDQEEVQILTDFLTLTTVDPTTHDKAMGLYSENYHRTTLLVLRGLLATGVLFMALNKRWRVNYGINPNPQKGSESKRLSAVPFRAKDVAAERTEFGHPDVAIIFTQLSYYYQGLSDSQILESFKCLSDRTNGHREYERWISSVHSPHPSITSLSGVNLKDYEQRTRWLFPAMRHNMVVIDFWLNHSVFPREGKVFGWKMSCSPWDLSHSHLPVTGFSGTNDTKLLLPLHISQQDLPQLLGTNGKVLDNLMVPQNNNYETLQNTQAVHIIRKLVATQNGAENQITVLLDVGALMLELSNEMIAVEWLKASRPSIEAAVYFDLDDVLMVRDRRGRKLPLQVSPFVSRLDHCVVYLDDGHTRGTDLKLPRGTSAAVTLGKGLGKDKFVQCCMRMRMLGNGHRVHFWSSAEVHNEILGLMGGGKLPETQDVIAWTLQNSIEATGDGFMHWVNAGLSFRTKMAAFEIFGSSRKTPTDYQHLGERCSEKEVVLLEEMYGHHQTEAFFPDIVANRIQASRAGMEILGSHVKNQPRLQSYSEEILNHCKNFVPSVKKMSRLLDEEQERELEHELEEELESPRPGPAFPNQPKLEPDLLSFVQNGNTRALTTCCIPLPAALENTTFRHFIQPDNWGRNMFATKDFSSVVKTCDASTQMDKYLRPVTWFLTLPHQNGGIVVLISTYEANELLPLLKSGKSPTKLHLYAARLHANSDTLLGCPELCVPSTNSLEFHSKYLLNFPHLRPSLFIFSGSLYFRTKEEQDEFCGFCGYLPKPRSREEEIIFRFVMRARVVKRVNVRDCFVDQGARRLVPSIVWDCTFTRNPHKMIKGIIEARHDMEVPRDSHVHSVIVRHCKGL